MKTSLEYRRLLAEDSMDIEEVYEDIQVEIGDIISFVKCYDPEECLDLLGMVEVAEAWVDRSYGAGYKNNEQAKILARHMIKTLVNSMYFNRSFEIPSNAKTSAIINNIGAILSSFEEDE